MKKFILLFSLFITTTLGLTQNKPTLLSYEIDTMCNNDFGVDVIHTIMVEDLDGDNTSLLINSYNAGFFSSVSADNPPPVGGQTVRTFTITASAGTGIAPGLNLSDFDISVYGNIGPDGGYLDTLLQDVAIYGDLGITTTFNTLTMCANDNPVDIRPYAFPAGGSFNWTGEESYMFDPTIYYAQSGMYIFYTYTNDAGCSDSYMGSGPVIYNQPTVFINPPYSTCGNADATADAYISSGLAPYDVYWSTGLTEITSASSVANNLAAGNYYINITDANGCKAVGIAQISDSEVDLSGSPIDESCMFQSEDGGVDLYVSSTGGSVSSIYWSNGQTAEDLVGVHKGEYLVKVRTDLGCEGNTSFFVSAIPFPYASSVNSTDASCSTSNGAVDYDMWNGTAPFTYLWNTGATTEDLLGVSAGTYTCLVTDNLGCTFSYSHQVSVPTGPGASIMSIVDATCGSADGMINMDVYPFSAPIISTSWSSGQLTEDLINVPAGDYTITVVDQDGCSFNRTVSLGNVLPERPEICLLTVDSSLTYNSVVWEKDLSQLSIAGYNVYRETSTYGVFELIAERPYILESYFQDNDASPIDRSWRYQISVYDDCGNESYMSDVHKTIHIVTNTSDLINYTISWDDYEGMNYASVDVFRFDSTNGWMNIGNVPYGTNSIPDMPTISVGLDYMAEFIPADICTSTKAKDHNSSRSNKSNSIFNPGGTTAEIKDEDLGYISIYPNPATDVVTLHIDQPELFQSFEITNLNGELIFAGTIYTHNTFISTEELAAGVYLIKLISADKVIVEKLMKN